MRVAFTCRIALATTVLSLWGCDQLTATVQAVSVITRTPELKEAYGMDPLLVDALPQDENLQKVTAALVGIGERDSVTSTAAPTPVTDAEIYVAWEQNQVRLCAVPDPQAAGTYQATSLTSEDCGDPTLDYVVGATYTTTIETASADHTLSITAPPAIDPAMVTFTPALGPKSDMAGAQLMRHAINTALTVDWSADAQAAGRPTFAVLARVNYDPQSASPAAALDATSWQADPNNPIFDTLPRQPADMIDLVTQEPPTSITLDGALFDSEGLYVLVLTSAELSTDTSASLSFGSGALAGYGTAFVFWVE